MKQKITFGILLLCVVVAAVGAFVFGSARVSGLAFLAALLVATISELSE